MVTTGLIWRNHPWLLGWKISPCSMEREVHFAKDIRICCPALLPAPNFWFPSAVRPTEALHGNCEQGSAHNPARAGRGHRCHCVVICGFRILDDSFMGRLLFVKLWINIGIHICIWMCMCSYICACIYIFLIKWHYSQKRSQLFKYLYQIYNLHHDEYSN